MITSNKISGSPNQILTARPRLEIPRSPLENTLTVLSVLGLIFAFYLLFQYLPNLPDIVPTHYNFSGQIDSWGSKYTLAILPGAALFVFLMLTILERYPHVYNYPFPLTQKNVRTQYALSRSLLIWMKFEIVYFFIYIEWKTIQAALGMAKGLGPEFLFLFIGTIMATIIIHFIRLYQAR